MKLVNDLFRHRRRRCFRALNATKLGGYLQTVEFNLDRNEKHNRQRRDVRLRRFLKAATV